MKKHLKKLALVLAAALVCTSLVACKHFRNPHCDPERMVQMVQEHLDKVLDKINVTDGQREKIILITDQMIADAKQVQSAHADTRVKIVECVLLDEPDSNWLHDKVDEKAKAWSDFSHRSVDRFIEISAVLTPEQRAELKERFSSAHGAGK